MDRRLAAGGHWEDTHPLLSGLGELQHVGDVLEFTARAEASTGDRPGRGGGNPYLRGPHGAGAWLPVLPGLKPVAPHDAASGDADRGATDDRTRMKAAGATPGVRGGWPVQWSPWTAIGPS